MSDTFTTPYTTRDPSVDGIQQRDVHDRCRNLFPGASTFLALVSSGKVSDTGEVTQQSGLIGKKGCAGRRFEYYTYTPWVTVFEAVSESGGTVTVTSGTGLLKRRTLLNDRTLEVARVVAVSGATFTYTAITAAFTIQAGDKLLMMAPAYEEASSDPHEFQKNEDMNYNTMQIVRYPWSMSRSALQSKNYMFGSGQQYNDTRGKRNMIEGNILIERSLFLGQRAAVTTTDLTTDSTNGDFSTMRGFMNQAQNEYSCGNAMTPEKWITDLPESMGKTITANQKIVAFTSGKIFGEMQMWAYDKWMSMKDGELKKFGVRSKVFMTSKFDIEIIHHTLFDESVRMSNKMFIMCPDDALYVYRNNRDIHVNPKEIQSSSTDAVTKEVIGEITCAELTGGNNCTVVSDWF